MSAESRLSDLELAALLCSRVCHDVISPVGAIANGIEVLDEETDEEMRESAYALIRKSVRQASAKLMLARLAFGAAGSAGASLDLGEVEDICRAVVADGKVTFDWQAPRETRPKDEVKLLLNMILIALSALPRGGTVTVKAGGDVLAVAARGEKAKLPEGMAALISGEATPGSVEPRSVQAYHAGRLAAAAGRSLSLKSDGNTVALSAGPLAEAA